jgi:hypothetical protein
VTYIYVAGVKSRSISVDRDVHTPVPRVDQETPSPCGDTRDHGAGHGTSRRTEEVRWSRWTAKRVGTRSAKALM